MKIKCSKCQAIQQIQEEYNYQTIKCRKCNADIIAIPYDEPTSHQPVSLPTKETTDPRLPGTTLAKIWYFIGNISLVLCAGAVSISTLITFSELVQKTGTYVQGEDRWELAGSLIRGAVLAGALSFISFSVAAIINAISANTMELRKVIKANSDKGK